VILDPICKGAEPAVQSKANAMMFLLFPEKHPIVDVKKAMKLLDPETARYDKIFRVMSSIQPMSGMMVATKKYVEGVDVENSSRASGASLLEEMAKAREASPPVELFKRLTHVSTL